MKENSKQSFSQFYDKKNSIKNTKNTAVTLIPAGIVVIVFSELNRIISVGFEQCLYTALVIFGIIILLVGVLIPQRLYRYINWFSEKLLNKLGLILLKVIMTILYIVFSPLLSLYSLLKKRKFFFLRWNSKNNEIITSFVDDRYNVPFKSEKTGNVIVNLLRIIIDKKMYLMIPLTVIILILGIVFFFVSSSTVFSFVYTIV